VAEAVIRSAHLVVGVFAWEVVCAEINLRALAAIDLDKHLLV
jgi:hypothetical protein